MVENFALYSQIYDSLPDEQMAALAGDADFSTKLTADGRSFIYRWPHLTVTINEMPAKEVPGHLAGFCGYVNHIYNGQPDERGMQLMDRIRYTRLVAGMIVEPERDKQGAAEKILGAMVYGLGALVFYQSALYDRESKLILAPDGSFDEGSDHLGPVAEIINNKVQITLPERKLDQATSGQDSRYQRALAELKPRKVPTLNYALYINDDKDTKLRTPDEVARRAIVLSAVTLLADGGDLGQSRAIIEQNNLWSHVTPEERKLLDSNPTDAKLARKLLWRLEGLWVLVWVLNDVELPWPCGTCDVPRLTAAITNYEKQPDFQSTAKLRSKAEVLDALQLTMLQHWAIRDAYVHQRDIPSDLDWSGSAQMMPVHSCPTTGVVAERHHALNWLVCFGDVDWDDVDTPT